jgi:two-component system, sporulation sensor kinase D
MSNPYLRKKRWKYLLMFFAVLIAASSLLYTKYLVKNIAKSERTRAQVWALSMKQVFTTVDEEQLNYVFLVRDSLTVPAIVTDEKGGLSIYLPNLVLTLKKRSLTIYRTFRKNLKP